MLSFWVAGAGLISSPTGSQENADHSPSLLASQMPDPGPTPQTPLSPRSTLIQGHGLESSSSLLESPASVLCHNAPGFTLLLGAMSRYKMLTPSCQCPQLLTLQAHHPHISVSKDDSTATQPPGTPDWGCHTHTAWTSTRSLLQPQSFQRVQTLPTYQHGQSPPNLFLPPKTYYLRLPTSSLPTAPPTSERRWEIKTLLILQLLYQS